MFDLHHPDGLKAARHALGLTLSQMALALELADPHRNGKDTVRFWESGKRSPAGPVRVALRLMLEQAGLA
jgi:DNA-binding transcriptional regulator YiaG